MDLDTDYDMSHRSKSSAKHAHGDAVCLGIPCGTMPIKAVLTHRTTPGCGSINATSAGAGVVVATPASTQGPSAQPICSLESDSQLRPWVERVSREVPPALVGGHHVRCEVPVPAGALGVEPAASAEREVPLGATGRREHMLPPGQVGAGDRLLDAADVAEPLLGARSTSRPTASGCRGLRSRRRSMSCPRERSRRCRGLLRHHTGGHDVAPTPVGPRCVGAERLLGVVVARAGLVREQRDQLGANAR